MNNSKLTTPVLTRNRNGIQKKKVKWTPNQKNASPFSNIKRPSPAAVVADAKKRLPQDQQTLTQMPGVLKSPFDSSSEDNEDSESDVQLFDAPKGEKKRKIGETSMVDDHTDEEPPKKQHSGEKKKQLEDNSKDASELTSSDEDNEDTSSSDDEIVQRGTSGGSQGVSDTVEVESVSNVVVGQKKKKIPKKTIDIFEPTESSDENQEIESSMNENESVGDFWLPNSGYRDGGFSILGKSDEELANEIFAHVLDIKQRFTKNRKLSEKEKSHFVIPPRFQWNGFLMVDKIGEVPSGNPTVEKGHYYKRAEFCTVSDRSLPTAEFTELRAGMTVKLANLPYDFVLMAVYEKVRRGMPWVWLKSGEQNFFELQVELLTQATVEVTQASRGATLRAQQLIRTIDEENRKKNGEKVAVTRPRSRTVTGVKVTNTGAKVDHLMALKSDNKDLKLQVQALKEKIEKKDQTIGDLKEDVTNLRCRVASTDATLVEVKAFNRHLLSNARR